MGTISIRGVDDQLARLLKEKARQGNKSVNQMILDTLKKQFGLEKPKRFSAQHHDLDQLFGLWSQEEFDRMRKNIDEQRQVDEEVWR